MKLVIVESPAKCITIKKYLGNDYNVMASIGHIRDLAISGKGGLGVDIEKGFVPTYIINKDKYATVHALQQEARNAEEVILATDPDREGEAIAWHLANVLNLDINTTKRLEFHEITRESITEAIANPRTINLNIVSSQETRRILDRIIGFSLSTLLYKKIKSRSAGRVQSATLSLINEHDKEIENFVSEEYWNILVKAKIANKDMDLTYLGNGKEKPSIANKEQADKILESIPKELTITKVNKDFRSKESKDPLTTSTMQQEAYSKLKFKTSKTQAVAQQLYEGLELNGEHVGLITYMRTDSNRLSVSFIEKAKGYIIEQYGKDYLGSVKPISQNELAQGAHEAIRPTSCHRTPESVRKYLTPDQYNLYKLIYNRAIGSMMKPKKEEVLTIELNGNDNNFKIEFAHTVFKGYEMLYVDPNEEKEFTGKFPSLNVGEVVEVASKKNEQKFTQPPAHYSEAKLVKIMEEVGIGRPSTYASTIDLLSKRSYVKNTAGVLTMTEQGKKTCDVLGEYFPDIVDVKYTASMEAKLDTVEEGSQSRVEMLTNFYNPFMKEVEYAKDALQKEKGKPTGRYCPKCGAELIIKDSKNGQFVGCSNYPECDYIEKEEKKKAEETGEMCPKCGKPLVYRIGQRNRKFIACSGFPSCDYTVYPESIKIEPKPIEKACPKCGAQLVKKKGRYGQFIGCSNYPTCDYMEKAYKKSYSKKVK